MPTPNPPHRWTPQAAAVRAAMLNQDGFRSAQAICAVLRSEGRAVGLSTVYRHLRTFTEEGLADAIHKADGETIYRLCGAAGRHHHHLVCRHCGRAVEVHGRAVERWANEMARQHGYSDISHTIEIFGLCRQCADGRAH